MIQISPSDLSADFARLGEEVKNIGLAGADMVHLDVMDGHFVTNISFGLPIIASLRPVTDMVLDVHLMIEKPEDYVERFIEAGADIVTFHYEAASDIPVLLDTIRMHGRRAAISVKPKTPVEVIYPYLDKCDMILIMTVEPGYGGQALIPETLDKVRALRREIERRGLQTKIQVDGGVNEKTARDCIEAGADILVAGSAVFGKSDRRQAIEALRG